MGNLINAFLKYGGWFLFFFLEMFCFYLVVQHNQKQGEIYRSSWGSFTGSVYNKYNDASQFLYLSAVSDSLAKENAHLYEKLDNAKYVNTFWRDSVKLEDVKQKYTYITASVINNSVNRHNNYFTLDKGSNHGIKPRMGVFASSAGIIGVIKDVSPNFSQGLSILHKQSRVSAAVRRNNYYGSLAWEGSNPKIINFNDIPKHADLEQGDTIQTSGYSSIFPRGLMIGKIDTFWLEDGSNFYDIEVELTNDMARVYKAYVVDNLMEEEQLNLEKEEANNE